MGRPEPLFCVCGCGRPRIGWRVFCGGPRKAADRLACFLRRAAEGLAREARLEMRKDETI